MTPGPAFGFNQRPYIYYNGEWHQCPCTISGIPVGTSLKAGAWVKEKNNESGRGWFGPNIGTSTKCWMSEPFSGNETKWIECSFDMPSSASSVEFKCGSLESDIRYIHDTDCCITLELGVETCDQLVKVVDPALNPIGDAQVLVSISETVSAMCYTDSAGFCYIKNLPKDKLYLACASKSGYADYKDTGCAWFTACSPFAVLLTLHKSCKQGFLVKDQDNNLIGGATVTVTPIDKTCSTNASGWCEIELSEGLYYDVEATKSGYECYDSECRKDNFKCVPSSSLLLKLKETVPPECTTDADCPAGYKCIDGKCVKKECKDYLTKTECETAGCYWWSGACHRSPEGAESWKSVSEPYWDADVVKIDCVAQNLSAISGYFAIAYCDGTLVSTYQKLKPDGASERSVVLNIPKEKIDKSCSPLPFNVEIVLTREWTEIDRVTKIIPKKEAAVKYMFISPPVNDPTIKKASDLAKKIGTICIEIVKWDSAAQAYVSYIPGVPLNDFDIELGEGYFVTLKEIVDMPFSGTPWESPFTKSFVKGQTSFGLPFVDPTIKIASDLASKLGAICTDIIKWDAVNQKYVSYVPGWPSTDFPIVVGEGYFVMTTASKDVVFTSAVVPKEDTTICNFDVLDSEGKEVTDLVAGVRYTVRAWLCKVEGGGCAEIYKGCDSGCEVEGEELKLFLFGGGELAKGTTNVDGYASMYWTPSADIAGDNSIRIEFFGSTNYNACESDWKTVKVGGLRIKCDCTNIDVGDYVFLQEVEKVGDSWVWYVLGGGEVKEVTEDKVVYFTEHDPILGFEVGKHYAIVAWKWWEWYMVYKPLLNFIVPDYSVIELKEGLNEITVRYQVSIIGTTICGFFGIEPESTECGLFLAEFIDPVFVANTLSVIIKHEDLEGNAREPETLDYIMLPIVMVGSLLPMVPAGKIGQWVGRGLKLGKRPDDLGRASRLFLINYQDKIHHLTAVGDETRILRFKTFFDADNLDEALKVLSEGVTSSEATEALKSTKRLNLAKWIRGLLAKWKKDKPKTTIEKLMDDTAEHGGNVFKTQVDTLSKHADDAVKKADFTNIRKQWLDSVKDADDVVHLDRTLFKEGRHAQAMHNVMRYSDPEYITALKNAGRFDKGVDFLIRHLGDTATPGERGFYRTVIRGIDDVEMDRIIINLNKAGELKLGRAVHQARIAARVDDAAEISFTAAGRKLTDYGDDLKGLYVKGESAEGVVDATHDAAKYGRRTAEETASADTKAQQFYDELAEMKEQAKKMGVEFKIDAPPPSGNWEGKITWYVKNADEGHETGLTLKQFLRKDKWSIISRWATLGVISVMVGDVVWWGTGWLLGYSPTRIQEGAEDRRNVIRSKINDIQSDIKQAINAYRYGEKENSIIFFAKAHERCIELAGDGGLLEKFNTYLRDNSGTMGYPGYFYIVAEGTPDETYVPIFPFWFSQIPKLGMRYSEFLGDYEAMKRDFELECDDLPTTWEEIQDFMKTEREVALPIHKAPDRPSVSGVTTTSAVISWKEHKFYVDSLVKSADTYSLYFKGEKAPIKGAGNLSATARKFTVTGLKPNTKYLVVLTAWTSGGMEETLQSDAVSFTTVTTCPTPSARFTPSTTKPKVGETVVFDPSGSDPGTGASYKSLVWDFGDDTPKVTKTTEEKVSHPYSTKGIYSVNLKVTNDCGKSRDASPVVITVEVPTGWIECYCTCSANANPSYCDATERGTKILVDGKEKGLTRTSGYTKIIEETGSHLVQYNLFDVMKSTLKEVIVKEGEGVAYHGDLQSVLPTSQPAKVTAIIDGDSIRTDVTDGLPIPLKQKDHQKVRIVGYDAYGCTNYPTECTTFGRYAHDKLAELIPVGSTVTLKVDEHLPLGYYNRVIAGIFTGVARPDIAIEMLKSCLVEVNKKSYLEDFEGWIDPEEYLRLWKDPNGTDCILHPDHKPLIVDIGAVVGTWKIDNRWKALYFKVDYYDKGNKKLNPEDIDLGQIEGGKVSGAITYYANTYLIRLFASVDIDKPKWVETDYKFITPVTKTVTIECEQDANIYVNGVKVTGGVAYLERLSKTLRKYRT